MPNSSNGLSWDLTTPVSASPRKDGAAEVLGLRTGTALRINKEHNALVVMGAGEDTSTGGGEHVRGSAIAFFQDAAPTTRVDADGTTLDAADSGRLWVDSTGSAYVMKVYDDGDTSFHEVSGVSIASGNFTGAAFNSATTGSPLVLPVTFVPDVMHYFIRTATDGGFSWSFLQRNIADLTTVTIAESTVVNLMVLAMRRNGNDMEIWRDSGTLNALAGGQCEWLALKF